MPPSYGGALVDIILANDDLNSLWQDEVTEMRERMIQLRALLVDNLAKQGASKDFGFINQQKGMFSFLCIKPEQVQKLRAESSVYFVDSSRVNIAGINTKNVETLAAAIAGVL